MSSNIWLQCLQQLEKEVDITNQLLWIKTLQTQEIDNKLLLYAPNKYTIDNIRDKHLNRIKEIVSLLSHQTLSAQLILGSIENTPPNNTELTKVAPGKMFINQSIPLKKKIKPKITTIDSNLTFDRFIEGSCNTLAKASALQVANTICQDDKQSSGHRYNPLLIYSGVGLGKTHLLHAIGNKVLELNPEANVFYCRSEKFVQEMVTAIQQHKTDEFKQFYRSVDVLMVDDIQFFANKKRTQEEFFHTFNALLEDQKQIIMTSDTYPKDIENLEDRLKSRFGWGLSIAIEIPEVETRVAILLSKAEQKNVALTQSVAFFIAESIQSNIRELEGALNRVVAIAQFTGKAITIDFAKKALQDLITIQNKQVSLENIQKVVADFYHIRLSELLSKKRTQNIARPRQMAMYLSKELTNYSLPEIGFGFGGKDHTTVLYACRKIGELFKTNEPMKKEYQLLKRLLIH